MDALPQECNVQGRLSMKLYQEIAKTPPTYSISRTAGEKSLNEQNDASGMSECRDANETSSTRGNPCIKTEYPFKPSHQLLEDEWIASATYLHVKHQLHPSSHLTPNLNLLFSRAPILQIQPTNLHPLLRKLPVKFRPHPVRVAILGPRVSFLRPGHVVFGPRQFRVREA